MIKKILRAAIRLAAMAAGSGQFIGPGAPCAAATTTLASTNDYYYTVPRSDKLAGRVMGENGDYKLVRHEDVAWINEAWAERIALGEDSQPEESAFPENKSVRGRNGNSWEAEGEDTRAYWTNGTIRTTAITNEWISKIGEEWTIEKIMYRASGGEATNREMKIIPPMRGKLVTMNAVTNAYRELKEMKYVVKGANPSCVAWEEKYNYYIEQWENGEKAVQLERCVTNEFEGVDWRMMGGGEHETWRIWGANILSGEMEVEWWGENKIRIWQGPSGKAKVEAECAVRNTNDWLRGESAPKVVEEVRAYGVVRMKGNWYDIGWKIRFRERDEETWVRELIWTNDLQRTTNATVLVDMGSASWKGAKEDTLTWEVEVDVPELMAQCAAVAEGMPTKQEIEAKNTIPGFETSEWEEGEVASESSLECEIVKMILMIKLKPVTSLPGW